MTRANGRMGLGRRARTKGRRLGAGPTRRTAGHVRDEDAGAACAYLFLRGGRDTLWRAPAGCLVVGIDMVHATKPDPRRGA